LAGASGCRGGQKLTEPKKTKKEMRKFSREILATSSSIFIIYSSLFSSIDESGKARKPPQQSPPTSHLPPPTSAETHYEHRLHAHSLTSGGGVKRQPWREHWQPRLAPPVTSFTSVSIPHPRHVPRRQQRDARRVPRHSHVVAVQVEFESKDLKSGYHIPASRVETRRSQAMRAMSQPPTE
jgi:hypothetical protein